MAQSPSALKRLESAVLRRVIPYVKPVARRIINRLSEQGVLNGQPVIADAGISDEDRATFEKITRSLDKQSQQNFPGMPREDAAVLELARLVAPRLARMSGNPAHGIFYASDFHLLRKHYYLPIPDNTDQLDQFWTKPSAMVGVSMNDDAQLRLMSETFPRHLEEFRGRYPIQEAQRHGDFYLLNGSYMAVDSHVYYAFIREMNPRRIVEIGTGYSTVLACDAASLNQRDFGRAPEITAIDPYPWDLFSTLKGLKEVVAKKVQDVPLEVFTSLQAGDILFIDSTHVLRSGSDVQYEFLEILPRLAPGVLVHVHDISLPLPYPKVYYDNQTYWNEQYLLQAFLCNNNRFEVVWAGNYMMLNHRAATMRTFPEFELMREKWTSSEPTAFWMRSK